MYSTVPMRPHGSFRSTAMLLRHVCGNLKFGSVTARLVLAGGSPVTRGRLVVVGVRVERVVGPRPGVVSVNPVSMPVLPIWFEIQTNAGLPVKMPMPPRTCVIWSPLTSQLIPTRGDHSGDAFGQRARCRT